MRKLLTTLVVVAVVIGIAEWKAADLAESEIEERLRRVDTIPDILLRNLPG